MMVSGYSQGGMLAALLSMWLKQKKSKTVTTINLGAVGVRCMAGRLDLDATQSNPQITNYAHPFDGFGAMDVQPGKVCSYGGNLFSSSAKELVSVFSTAVGYTGAQLMAGKALGEPAPTDAFKYGRFWTHSPLYASQVLAAATIDNNGAVDGETCTLTPASDMEKWCPSVRTYPILLFNPPKEIHPCLKNTGAGGADLEFSYLKVVTLPKGGPFPMGGSCLLLGPKSYFIFVHMSSNKTSNGYIGVHFRYTTRLYTFEGNTAFEYKSLKTRLRIPYLRFSKVSSKASKTSTYALKAGTKVCTPVASNGRTCVSLGNEKAAPGGRRLGSVKSSSLSVSGEVDGVSGASMSFDLAEVSGDGAVATKSTVTASKGDATSGLQQASTFDEKASEAQVIAEPTAAPVTTSVSTVKTKAPKPAPKPSPTPKASPNPKPTPAAAGAAAKITAVITLKGLDFDKVSKSDVVVSKLKASIKAIFLKSLGDNAVQDLLVTLSKGSVKAQVDITPKPDASLAGLTSAVTARKDVMATAILKQAKDMPEVKDGSMLETGKKLNDLAAFAVVNDPRTGQPSKSAPIEGAVVDGSPARSLIWLWLCAATWALW
jgi:hypothetical protein